MRRAAILTLIACGLVFVPARAATDPECGGNAPLVYQCRILFTAEADVTRVEASSPTTAGIVIGHIKDSAGDEQRVVCSGGVCAWTQVPPHAFQAGEVITLDGTAIGVGAWSVRANYP